MTVAHNAHVALKAVQTSVLLGRGALVQVKGVGGPTETVFLKQGLQFWLFKEGFKVK